MSDKDGNIGENLVRQLEEIETLEAIYGEDFTTTDVDNKTYEVWINNKLDSKHSTTLRITLPVHYPSHGEPVFEIMSSWMSTNDYEEMTRHFQELFYENVGEILLFQCIEKLRQFVEQRGIELEELNENEKPHVRTNVKLDIVESINDIKVTDNYHDDEVNNIHIIHGEPLTDRKSTFQAHLASITSRTAADLFLTKLKKMRKVANASHNIMAYRIYNEAKDSYIQDCDDDGENAAGSRLLHLLQITGAKDVIVVVTRWYGGLMLGPDRFKHYNNCARALLQSAGLVETKLMSDHKDSKGRRKTKAKKHK